MYYMPSFKEFILNKILMRSFLASFAPIIIYSIGYPIYRFGIEDDTKENRFEYTNPYAWIVIAAFILLYPLN